MNSQSEQVPAASLETLGKYRIEGVLGEGGMGVVYKGYDPLIDRRVALKTIRKELLAGAAGEDLMARFRREAIAAGRCTNAHIVTVFDYGEDQGIPFIAMEYVEGRELKDFLRDGRRFDLDAVLNIVTQVLDALDFAHSCGVVHRDIKPANVILVADTYVKVSDFGIARIDDLELTQSGMMVGTPLYMSPEQFTGQAVDHRSDLYSTGVLLYELLAGERPFPGGSVTEITAQVLNETPPDVRRLNVEVPAAVAAAVGRALEKDPGDRFQSAREFAQALRRAPREPSGPPVADGADDATVLASPPGAVDERPGSAAQPGTLPGEVLRQAEEALTSYIGPLARILVRKAAAQTDSVEELYRRLAARIPSEEERSAFLRKSASGASGAPGSSPGRTAVTGLTGGTSASAFDAETLKLVENELAAYMGPIAGVLTRKASRGSATLEQLAQQLASHITGEDERAAFIRRVVSAVATDR